MRSQAVENDDSSPPPEHDMAGLGGRSVSPGPGTDTLSVSPTMAVSLNLLYVIDTHDGTQPRPWYRSL